MDWQEFHDITKIRKVRQKEINWKMASGVIDLPKPLELKQELGKTIRKRRSRRNLRHDGLSLEQLATLLFYGGGQTGESKGVPLRAAPSAGACHPTELQIINYGVDGLEQGLYRYDWTVHKLILRALGNPWREMAVAALGQEFVGDCSAVIAISSRVERTIAKYGQRGYRYAVMDAAAVAENISLVIEALGFGSVWVGAFEDDALAELLLLDYNEIPLLLLPVGMLR